MTEPLHPLCTSVDISAAGDQWVVIPHGKGDVVVLNDSGRAVLVQCDGSRAVAELAEATASDTGADIATVHSDLTSFLTRLMQTGIIIDANDRQVHEGRQ